jgi:hypothetical protein
MVPGFQVWMMYDETSNVFGSFVTQGTAPVSPRRAQLRSQQARRARLQKEQQLRKVAEEKVEALSSEKEDLRQDVQRMEHAASELQSQVSSVQREKEEAQRRAEESEQGRLTTERRMNSFLYAVGNLDTFKKNGVVKGGQVGSAGEDLFSESLDLRSEAAVHLSAGDAGLGRIGSVKVFPSSLRKGRDYTVTYTPDRQRATVEVLNREAFLGVRRVVFGIED